MSLCEIICEFTCEALIQLQRLPFSDLKIDKSLVIATRTSKDARIIVHAMAELAHNLQMLATAEGVETEPVRTMLTEIGCDVAQGYLFAHPMPPNEVPDWIARHDARTQSARVSCGRRAPSRPPLTKGPSGSRSVRC